MPFMPQGWTVEAFDFSEAARTKGFFQVPIFTLALEHLNHANIKLPLGPLRYLFNSPQMHLWHHVDKLPENHPEGINYGISLSL